MGLGGTGILVGVLLVASYGCAAAPDPGVATPCMTNADCSATEKCRSQAPPGAHTAGPPPDPCGMRRRCSQPVDCNDGDVCVSPEQVDLWSCASNVCVPPCTASTCKADEVCRPNGVCEVARCDEARAPPCAEHWRCDPKAAVTESTETIAGAVDTDDPKRAVARGCVRVRCDEPEGFSCREDWECALARSPETTGCAAIPCEVLGHCSSDATYICAPTGSGPRPKSHQICAPAPCGDPFGCVLRNCEEGAPCWVDYRGENLGYCNPSAPDADDYGCSVHDCLESPNICAPDKRCAPTDPNADRAGCAPTCTEGASCGGGWSWCVPL